MRGATPVTSRRTRYVAIHPLRHDAPDQKGCIAYGSGAPPPTTSTTAGDSSPQTPTVRLGRCDTASTYSPGSKREALHPLRHGTPVTSRCTRYVALHPLRHDAPDQKGCNAYGSGAPPPTTSPIEEKLVLAAPTSPNRAAADRATPLSNKPPRDSIVPSAPSNAWRSVL